MEKTLLELRKGEQAEVVVCEGGHIVQRRLETMGLRPGKKISRVSLQLLGGPVIVAVDGRQTAMGRGMAGKVKVRII